jgi:hypothetical protein
MLQIAAATFDAFGTHQEPTPARHGFRPHAH